MRLRQPPYRLVNCDWNDWRFQESEEIIVATKEFDLLLERLGGYFGNWSLEMSATLRSFLERFPNHMDALHHYSLCLAYEGKRLDSLAFSEAAVAAGKRAFPKEFEIGRHRLPTGFVQNRPFLRALHGLMLAQRNLDLIDEAITTGVYCLALDKEDRMGARESLAYYYVETNRELDAVALFESEAYKERFGGIEYLHPLALIRLGREEDALPCLEYCLRYYPQVARFILNRRLPQPINGSSFGGMIMGSEFEGWVHAKNFGQFWRSNQPAMTILRKLSRPYAKNNWKRRDINLSSTSS